jgi:hypothetical protein
MVDERPAEEEAIELTATEAARRYNVSGSWLIRNSTLKGGPIKARMLGPLYVFDRASIEAWLESRPRRGDNRKQPKGEGHADG